MSPADYAVGQVMLVLAYLLQYSTNDPSKSWNPNRWLWNLHKIFFTTKALKVTPIGSLPGYAF